MIIGSNYRRAEVNWRDVDGQLIPFKHNADGTLERRAWEPLPGSQCIFLDCGVPEVLYEGNRGPGKTDALLMDFAQDVGKGWGVDWTGILFRKTYPDLQDVIAKSRRWFSVAYPDARFNATEATWEWPTGERLRFRQFAKASDYWKYHGHSYSWIAWEELCTYPDDACYKSMFSCLRSSRPGMPRKVRATCNPYGPGHNWVKARWQLPVPPGGSWVRSFVRRVTTPPAWRASRSTVISTRTSSCCGRSRATRTQSAPRRATPQSSPPGSTGPGTSLRAA